MSDKTVKFDFQNDHGHSLSGRLELPASIPRAYALFAHCFTCSKSSLAAVRISRTLTEMGMGVLRFDFTGLGNSEGDFSNTNFSSNVDDLVSAFDQLKKEYGAPELLIGHSLGGAAVLKAATLLSEVKAVVTIGAPSDVKHLKLTFAGHMDQINSEGEAEVELAGRKFKVKKQFIDDLNETNLLNEVSKLRKALLVMHSPSDASVSVEHASKIFLAAQHPKSFLSLDNADHLLTKPEDAQYVANVIGAWSDRYISKG